MPLAYSKFSGACCTTLANSLPKRHDFCAVVNPNPRRITIEISDNGIGIEPQFVGKVFAAFEQADSRSEGLGLGLAISKAIVEMHAGTIRAHSEGRGKGATFVIELPIRR